LQPKSKKRSPPDALPGLGSPLDGAADPDFALTHHGEPPAAATLRRRDEPTPAARALKLLARREHTRRELERKLAPHVPDAAELARLLDDFTARGWLSEARAAEQLVRLKRGRFGPTRIRHVLAEKGVPPHLIAAALESLKGTEIDAAREIWARKFKSAPATAAERARHVRFLQGRGFSVEVAMRVVRSAAMMQENDEFEVAGVKPE
jgi:regulatory protein